MKKSGLVLLMLMLSVALYGAFDDIGWTVRSKSMGNAMFGEFDGVNSMNYNPATISMTRSIQFYGAWDTPYAGLNDGTGINVINAMFVIPFWNKFSLKFDRFFTRRGALGFTMQRKSVAGDGVEYYHEGVYSMIYAKDLNDVISRGAKISLGVRMSLYDLGVGQVEDVTANAANFPSLGKISFGLDVGLTYDFSESIRLGLAYKNLISPNVSIMEGVTEKLPSELRLGANWHMGKVLFMKDANLGLGLVNYGRDSTDNRAAEMAYQLGFEFKQLSAQDMKGKPFKGEILAVRLGAVYQQRKNIEDIVNLSAGIGFMYVFAKKHQVNIDYCFEYGVNVGVPKHAAGLTYQILLPNSAFAYKEEIRKEEEFMELLEKKVEDKEKNKTPESATNTGLKDGAGNSTESADTKNKALEKAKEDKKKKSK